MAAPAASAATSARPAVTRLWWRGTAHAEVAGRSLDLSVETSLTVPQLEVRSTSFITALGPPSARTLILAADGAWLERGGTRSPLPAQLGVHERQQYSLYAWLLRVQQDPALRRRAERARGQALSLSAPPWPDVRFMIGRDDYPASADWSVEDAEPDKPRVAQHVAFAGTTVSNGIRWPRRFDITRGGEPYFALHVAAFRAG